MDDNGVRKGGFKPSTTLPYDIRYPPKLPDKIPSKHQQNGQTLEVDSNWAAHAKYIGLRDDLWGQGFETRLFNPDDPSLKGRYDPQDWEVQYRLGRPSERVHWNDLVTKWGLQVLDKAGFVNLDWGIPDALLAPRGRHFSKRPVCWRGEAIHPVFRKDMWKMANGTEIPDAEYYTMSPALSLASAMLEDPTTMCLFHAMATPSCHVQFEDQVLGVCTKLQVPDSLTEAEQASIYQKICDMRQWTHFHWADPKELIRHEALAFTAALRETTASALGTKCSRIAMSRLYSEALYNWRRRANTPSNYSIYFQNILNSAHVPLSHAPEGFAENLDSAPIRTFFLLATVTMHEFAHAFRMAYFPYSLSIREPWVGDSRDNEFGHAVVRHIFHGIPYASNFEPSPGTPPLSRYLQLAAYAPFGIYFTEKWNPWADPGKHHIVKGVYDDFKAPIVQIPLPARQLYDYFTVDLWGKDVPRYGLDAIRFVKIPEWASYRMPGPIRANPREQSTLR